MPGKHSLYELFGLTDKASPEDIQSAFAQKRAVLDVLPDGEEKHNRIAILIDARDVLLDRRQRADYDRRQRDRRQEGRRQADVSASGPSWQAVGLTLLLFVGLGYPAWHYLTQPVQQQIPPTATPAPAPTSRAAAPATDPGRDADALAADIASQLPPPPLPTKPTVAPREAAPGTPAPATAPQRSLAETLVAAAIGSIAVHTYAVIGGGGQGTGVAIDHDKLLTNCHVIAPNVHKGPLLAIHAASGKQTTITHAAFLVREDACVAHAPGLNAKPIAWGNANRLARGATIYSLGFAQGQPTFSAGTLVGVLNRSGQDYLISTNYCDFGVSGGPLVDGEGRLVGLTSGGTKDKRYCASLTAETARRVLDQTLIAIDGFPTDYLSNLRRHW